MSPVRQSAVKSFGKEGADEIDRILALPLTRLRIALSDSYKSGKFTEAECRSFLDQVEGVEPLGEQRKIMEAVAETGALPANARIVLGTPALQFAWAVVLTRRMFAADAPPLHRQPIYRQMLDSRGFYNEMVRLSRMLDVALPYRGTTFAWGRPGSWFYCEAERRHVNQDMYYTLLFGFEHTRAVTAHEIGHSLLTTLYMPQMDRVYAQTEQLDRKKKEQGVLSDDELVALLAARRRWKLMHDAFNYMEDVAMHRFAAQLGHLLPQNYADSLNYVGTILQNYGKIVLGTDVRAGLVEPPEKDDADSVDFENRRLPLPPEMRRRIAQGTMDAETAAYLFNQGKAAAFLPFFAVNGLFSPTENNWRRLRVFADDIRIGDKAGEDGFSALYDLSVGPRGSLMSCVPSVADMTRPPAAYMTAVHAAAEQRVQVMQSIWDRYLEPYAAVLLDDFEKKLRQKLKEKKNDRDSGDLEGDETFKAPEKERSKRRMPVPPDGDDDDAPQSMDKFKDAPLLPDEDSPQPEAVPQQPVTQSPETEARRNKLDAVDFEKLARENWNDFHRRIASLAPVIDSVANMIRKINETQRHLVRARADIRSLVPPQGKGAAGVDMNRARQFSLRRAAGAALSPEDHKRFHVDKNEVRHNALEFVVMIDGSISMQSALGKVRAIDVAVLNAAIWYMACRKAGVDCYIVMWGNKTPLIVADPDTPLKNVGKGLQALKDGMKCSTDLAPGLTGMIGHLAARVPDDTRPAGSTHIMIYSDGDLTDRKAAADALATICASRLNVTIDLAVLTQNIRKTAIEELAAKIGTGRKFQVVRGSDPQRVPRQMAAQMLSRARATPPSRLPDSVKRAQMKQVYKSFKR